jgi:transcriptional regulator with XRE-family HTH domain
MLRIKSPTALGSVLRETRTALQIPAADMAAMAGTTTVSLRRLEQGNPTTAITTLFKLLDELGIELHVSLPPAAAQISLPETLGKPRRTRVQP